MDRGDWWATVHRVTKHLDMTEPLSNNPTPEDSTLLLQSPPKAPLPNTSKWALEFHHVSFGATNIQTIATSSLNLTFLILLSYLSGLALN